MKHRNIAIVWDFDGTLTPVDSTSKVVEHFLGRGFEKKFWNSIKSINGSTSNFDWERILASDAPTWMYVLSVIAFQHGEPLTSSFFKRIRTLVQLYPGSVNLLRTISKLSHRKDFKSAKIQIHHFIVSAGLKEYVEQIVPQALFSGIWGCRYKGIYRDTPNEVESVPVFCMDETMKTRALFEISKGVFAGNVGAVNRRVTRERLWCPFDNVVYIGDGPTDVPALSLVRDRGGYGIVVYNHEKKLTDIKSRLKDMSAESRCDLIVPADFTLGSELHKALKAQCERILMKYQAEDFSK